MTVQDIKLMRELVCGVGHGMAEVVHGALTPEHWVNLVTGMPALIFHRIAVIGDMQTQSGLITQAFIESVVRSDKGLYEAESKKFEEQNHLRRQSIKQALIDITSLSVHDFAKSAAHFGTMLALDSIGLHALNLAASATGRSLVSKIATVLENPKAPQTMVEVAGIGRVAVQEGVEIANKAVQPIKRSPSVVQQSKQSVIQAAQELKLMESYGLKLIGENIWKFPRGVIYGDDRKFGNSLNHMFAHMTSDPLKNRHTIFSIPKEKMIALIDEAWMLKGNHLSKDPLAYIVDMKKVIGIQGETAIRIIVKNPGSVELRTAYPVKLEGII